MLYVRKCKSPARANLAIIFCRRSRVRELRGNVDPSVAPRRQRTLPLQRVRALLQDERHQQAARETKAKDGE